MKLFKSPTRALPLRFNLRLRFMRSFEFICISDVMDAFKHVTLSSNVAELGFVDEFQVLPD